jgi:hypothetical protein
MIFGLALGRLEVVRAAQQKIIEKESRTYYIDAKLSYKSIGGV